MKGWVLDKEEQQCADWILKNFFDYKSLDCWDCEIPADFEEHIPLKEMLNDR